LLFLSSTGFSQTLSINPVTADTNVCFTLVKSKTLLKKIYEGDKFKELNSICEKQSEAYKSLAFSQADIISDQDKIISNNEKVISLKDYSIGKLKEQLAAEQKNVRKQKVYKWVAIITGGTISGLLGYAALTK